jgi:periplasmic divalent cation tolerance protein
MSALFVYITCSSAEEAQNIAKTVVEQRLAACANIMAAHEAVYWWEGDVKTGQEVAVIFKTRAGLFKKLEAAIKALHSYEVPCIVALPIKKGHAPFLKWIEDEASL